MATDTQGKNSLIIGGAAVFVSLLYLAIETRVNTRAIQSAAYHDASMSFADMNLTTAKDPKLSELFRISVASDDAEVFTVQENYRFILPANQLFWRYQDFYDQSRNGSVEEYLWVRGRNFAHVLVQRPVWRRWWQTIVDSDVYPASFVEAIKSAPDREYLYLSGAATGLRN